MIRLAMAGAAGRMGRAILKLAIQDPDIAIVGGLELPESSAVGMDIGDMLGFDPIGAKISSDVHGILKKTDVLIDFTHVAAIPETLKAVVKTKTRYVLGTTGIETSLFKKIKTASHKIAIVQSPNMSVGVNLLFGLTELAAKILDPSYDAEIFEIHHRQKKDAPSGTAVKLLEVLAAARKQKTEKDAVFGRKGNIGARRQGELGVLASRGGDVIGDHTVFFLGDGERVELSHRASSRDAFAKGAVLAAKFIAKKHNGLYDMGHVLGMKHLS